MQQAVGRRQTVELQADLCVTGQCRVSDTHTFRATGGARGEHHVRQIVADGVAGRIVGMTVIERVDGIHTYNVDRRCGWQTFKQRMLRQQDAQTAVFNHPGQAFLWVVGVERNIDASSLEHGQQADDHVRRTLYGDTHSDFRADGTFDQGSRQLVGRCVELRIAQLQVANDQRERVGCCPCLTLE